MYGIRDSGMESNFVCNQAETGNYIHCYAMITYAYRRLHAKLFGLDKQPKLTVQLRLFLVEVVGVVPLAETPRSDVINVVLCQRVTYIQICVRQSVLLPQNGSHPQLRPQAHCRPQKKKPP